MLDGAAEHRVVRFGIFELDRETRELRRENRIVALQDQPFRVLAFLLLRPGTLASREELRQALWPAGTFVEFDQGLNTAIKKIRAALRDSADNPRFIETIPRKGYRFIAPVEVVVAGPPVGLEAFREPVLEQPREPAEPGKTAPLSRRRLMPAMVGGLVVALTAYTLHRSPSAHVSLAVVPFDTQNSSPNDQYFSEGLAEEVVQRLTKTERLRIIRWPEKPADVRELGRNLNVRAVLRGSVTKTGDRLRVTASLTDCRDGSHIWAGIYDRDSRDVFAMQDEVFGAITGALGMQLSDSPRRRPARLDLRAFEVYLQGRFLLNWKDIPTTKKAIAKFQDVLAIDPNHASAYAGLADCYERLAWLEAVPPLEILPRMKEAALEALRLDETSAEAHASLGNYLGWSWDIRGADREYRRAAELNPNYALVRMNYGVLLSALGRHEEGLAQTRRAMRLEPLSLAAAFTLGVQLLWAGSYQESLEHLRRSAELAPTVPAAHSRLATVLLARGMHREAIAEFQRAMDLADGHPYARAMLAHAYGVAGRAAEAKTLLRELIASAEHEYVPPLHLARTYLGLGERDQALDWLERSYADPASSAWPFHLLDPMFENLRGEPRFVALLKKVHLR